MKDLNTTSGQIVDRSIAVHSELGPGLLESAYESCLALELRNLGCKVVSQVPVPLVYKSVCIDVAYRLDLLVDDCVVTEIKTDDTLLPIHEAQLLSYLKLGGYKLGLLINFHVPHLKDGIRRMVNHL